MPPHQPECCERMVSAARDRAASCAGVYRREAARSFSLHSYAQPMFQGYPYFYKVSGLRLMFQGTDPSIRREAALSFNL